jgi:hypothetical protein
MRIQLLQRVSLTKQSSPPVGVLRLSLSGHHHRRRRQRAQAVLPVRQIWF